MKREHRYRTSLEWTGNDGTGTSAYRAYRRDHEVSGIGKKATIPGSSDPSFFGDAARYNPEELLVASLSACHMLWYLGLAANAHISVVAYRDEALGEMLEEAGGEGRFTRVMLRPEVTLAPGSDIARAEELHSEAHEKCFIARSVNFGVVVEGNIRVAN